MMKTKVRTIRSPLGGMQIMTIVNESGLYSLVFKSQLPSAKKFKRWVTSEVLPTIRKTGSYQIPADPMDALRLMFQATEHTQEKVNQVDARVIHLEAKRETRTRGIHVHRKINFKKGVPDRQGTRL